MSTKPKTTKQQLIRIFEFLETRSMLNGDPLLREAMANEGYLRYAGGDAVAWGHERAGFTQTVHPANLGDKDNGIGYDYGINRVAVRAVVVDRNLRSCAYASQNLHAIDWCGRADKLRRRG